MAQRLDRSHYQNMPPFTTYIARVVFMNTLAHNQQLKGVDTRHLRYSMLWPGMELAYVDEALVRFREESLYLDDNPDKPTQFQAAPNLSQAIQRAEQGFDDQDLETEIDRRMNDMFQKGEFDLLLFRNGHEDVPDETGKPKLVIPKYDRVVVSNPESPPSAVDDIFRHKGIGKGIRIYRNNLVFLVAFKDGVGAMYAAARRHLAMSKLAAPDSLLDFADYQRRIIKNKKTSSNMNLDSTILKCYKFAYYPAKDDCLDYTTMDWQKSGGQRTLIENLHSVQKIRTDEDQPDLPESLIDRVSGLKSGEITTLDFRNEFYRAPALPMLVGDQVFSAGILLGIKSGVFVYQSKNLLCGKGDPPCKIVIDGDSVVYTTKRARKLGIWPHKSREEEVIEPDRGSKDGDSEKGAYDAPPAFDLSSVRATGKPSQAVKSVLDELRKHDIGRISKMRIESNDDVFPILSMVGRIKEIKVGLEMVGDYQTDADGRFDFEFTGTLKDSEPVLEFLKPQLKNTSVGNIRVILNINFKNGADMDWLETLADRLRLVENEVDVSDIVGVSE